MERARCHLSVYPHAYSVVRIAVQQPAAAVNRGVVRNGEEPKQQISTSPGCGTGCADTVKSRRSRLSRYRDISLHAATSRRPPGENPAYRNPRQMIVPTEQRVQPKPRLNSARSGVCTHMEFMYRRHTSYRHFAGRFKPAARVHYQPDKADRRDGCEPVPQSPRVSASANPPAPYGNNPPARYRNIHTGRYRVLPPVFSPTKPIRFRRRTPSGVRQNILFFWRRFNVKVY